MGHVSYGTVQTEASLEALFVEGPLGVSVHSFMVRMACDTGRTSFIESFISAVITCNWQSGLLAPAAHPRRSIQSHQLAQ